MKTSGLKPLIWLLPEMILAIMVAVCFFGELFGTGRVSYSIGSFGVALALLMLWKNKYFSLVIAIPLGLVSLLMLGAVVSEFGEFPSVSKSALLLLTMGTTLFGSLLVISFLLPIKYFTTKHGRRS